MDIVKRLYKEANKDYQAFSKKIMPDTNRMLGVKILILRKLAKEIYKNEDWQNFLQQKDCRFWEELMLQAIVIGEIKAEPEKILNFVKNFVPKLNGWGVCDCFCASLKFTKNNLEIVWNFIQPYFNSKKEYEKRFAFVMMLTYFLTDKYIDECIEYIDKFADERYYAKMAAAWALSICYIKYPQKTLKYLKKSNLDKWTFNKGIQKICESLRVDKETKNYLKTLKK